VETIRDVLAGVEMAPFEAWLEELRWGESSSRRVDGDTLVAMAILVPARPTGVVRH
jgi:hypothetical protein